MLDIFATFQGSEVYKKVRIWGIVISVLSLILPLAAVGVIKYLAPTAIPFGVFELWAIKGNILELGAKVLWPVIFVALELLAFLTLSGLVPIFGKIIGHTLNTKWQDVVVSSALNFTAVGWLVFMLGIVAAKAADFLFLGFLNIHIVKFLFEAITLPIANFLTAGYLAPQLTGSLGWAVGASLVSVAFLSSKENDKLIGNWPINMFCMYIMFNYGLPLAILIKVAHDLLFVFGVKQITKRMIG